MVHTDKGMGTGERKRRTGPQRVAVQGRAIRQHDVSHWARASVMAVVGGGL